MRLKNTQLVLVGFVAFLVVVGLLDGFRMAHFALFFIHGPYRGYLFTKCWFGGCNNREITDHVQADVEYRQNFCSCVAITTTKGFVGMRTDTPTPIEIVLSAMKR